jgi:hypothetical protein
VGGSWWRRYPIRTWILAPLLLYLTGACWQGYVDRQQTAPPTVPVAERTVGPWTFYGMVGLYAILSFGMIGGWFVVDRRRES